jgi:hypothetical protein
MARTGRPKTDRIYEYLTLRCPEGLLDQWREVAREQDRSLNAALVRALRLALEEQPEPEPQARRATATV